MQVKKHPKFNLENYSKIFMQLGLVLALFVVYVAIEEKTYEKGFASVLTQATMMEDFADDTVITKRAEPEIPKPKPVILNEPDVVDDDQDIIETIVDSTEDNGDPIETFDIDSINEEDDPVDIEEDVPFIAIEDVPVFPGCKGDNDALKACFNKKMQKHFAKKFNSDLPNELGLSPGKKRIGMIFKIDKTGRITDIQVRAPHPKLEKEAKRVIHLLPQMKPGMQRGKPVRVKYALPMRIDVQ